MAIYIQPTDTRPDPTLMGQILPDLINYRVGYRFLKIKKKKTRSGSGSGPGFIHTRPEPGLEPKPNPFKGKIPKYPNLLIPFHSAANPTPLIPFHSAANPLTHITLLSHSAALTPSHSPHITLLSPTSNLCHHRPPRAPPVRLFSLFLLISAYTISHSHSLLISLTFKQRRPRS